ncbi:hypothetical protein [Roseococcus sp.]|uniref:hypothetical protein n=1 Tax=Roseococcus sp. TaxID=2109646 RepID=UPI003BADBC64
MSRLGRIWAALWRYAAHPDPVAAAGNRLAIVIGWNTPTYPLWLWLTAGGAAFPAGWLTLCAAPVFLAIPAVARRHPRWGRVLPSLVGSVNTAFCTFLLGQGSGTVLFAAPCAVLAMLMCREGELRARLALAGLALLVPLLPWGAGLAALPPEALAAVQAMNLFSVLCLSGFLALLLAPLISAAEPAQDRVAEGQAQARRDAGDEGAPGDVGQRE